MPRPFDHPGLYDRKITFFALTSERQSDGEIVPGLVYPAFSAWCVVTVLTAAEGSAADGIVVNERVRANYRLTPYLRRSENLPTVGWFAEYNGKRCAVVGAAFPAGTFDEYDVTLELTD